MGGSTEDPHLALTCTSLDFLRSLLAAACEPVAASLGCFTGCLAEAAVSIELIDTRDVLLSEGVKNCDKPSANPA